MSAPNVAAISAGGSTRVKRPVTKAPVSAALGVVGSRPGARPREMEREHACNGEDAAIAEEGIVSGGPARVIVGVGAVVFRGAEVLLIKRGKPPFEGKWSIPGGRVEFGEPLEAAVRREVLEETGVVADLAGLIGVFEALPAIAGQSRHMVMIDYAADWARGAPRAGDDAADARFFPLEEALEKVAWDETRRAVEMARAMRQPQ